MMLRCRYCTACDPKVRDRALCSRISLRFLENLSELSERGREHDWAKITLALRLVTLCADLKTGSAVEMGSVGSTDG